MGLARFFPPSSVLDDLLPSGNLARLTSNDLRFALLSYQRGRERVNFLGDWGLAGDEEGLRPYLATHFRWTALSPSPIGADGMLPNERQEPVDVTPEALQTILDDPVFQNLILIRRQRIDIVQRRSVQLGSLIAEVVEQIDRELARLGDHPPN
jgi:hypothetical protein